MKFFTFKKVIPTILIIAVLATGIFSTFGVGVVNAAEEEEFDPFNLPSSIKEKEKPNVINPRLDRPKGVVGASETKTTQEFRERDVNEEAKDEKLVAGRTLIDSKGVTTGCGLFNIVQCFNNVAAIIGQAVLSIFALFLGIAGWTLDFAVNYTVLDMGSNVKKIGFIEEGWKAFRDLANIVIIFALLIIGIATILRIENYGMKALLGKLILFALLINFSLFFTQVIIDASNLLALQFYQQIPAGNLAGIGTSYMNAFKLTTFYSTGNFQSLTQGINFFEILLISALGSIVYLVATFAFLASAFMLISRYVVLIFLMILAPLAFVGMILPATQSYAKKWWSTLLHYSFFAPAYFILTWFVINVINSPAFKTSIGLKSNSTFAGLGKGGAAAIEAMPITFNFIIIIFFIVVSILLANMMGIAGSNAVMSWGKSARKWGQGVVGGATIGMGGRVLRNTAGRGASKFADSKSLKDLASTSRAGRMILKATRGVAGSSFDARATKVGGAIGLGKSVGKGGYQEKLKQQVKDREKFAKSIGEESLNERQHKDKLATDLRKNEETLTKVKNEEVIVTAAANSPIESQVKEDAKRKLQKIVEEKTKLQSTIADIKKAEKAFKPGTDRQYKYAETIEKERIFGIPGLKVARKRKEGALAIRKAIKGAKNKKILDDIGKAIKVNEDDSSESKDKSEDESDKTT